MGTVNWILLVVTCVDGRSSLDRHVKVWISTVQFTMIGVLSLGVGNVSSVKAAFQRLNVQILEVSKENDLLQVSHLVIPGVGSMQQLMDRINTTALVKPLKKYSEIGYVLGICLGFQALFDFSYEGNCECLGLLPGEVLPLASNYELSANIGYRSLTENNKQMMNLIPESRSTDSRVGQKDSVVRYYFTHSYYVNMSGMTSHSTFIQNSRVPITAAAGNGSNIFGTQFHPELSHSIGKDLLMNFISL